MIKLKTKFSYFTKTLLILFLVSNSTIDINAQENSRKYEITAESIEKLVRERKIPSTLEWRLRSLIGAEIKGKNFFLDSLKTKIGDSLISRYQNNLLKYSIQPITINDLRVREIYGDIALNETIKVKVDNIQDWFDVGNSISDFILYLDGRAMYGLSRDGLDEKGRLQFDITLIDTIANNRNVWTVLVGRKQMGGKFFKRKVPLTIGIINGDSKKIKINGSAKGTLIRINAIWFYGFLAAMILFTILFFRLVVKSDIIRISGPSPAGLGKQKPYSLARTQMAVWFFLVVFAYVFIWMVTDDLTTLTPTVLGLIGISAATGLGAAAVDANKSLVKKNNLDEVEEEVEKVNDELEQLESQARTLQEGENACKVLELELKRKEIVRLDQKKRKMVDPKIPKESKDFLSDILRDDAGVSFHRFQIFIWTIVLAIIFIASVLNNLAMPKFDETLLALMGISGGTYIGFKFPEREG